MRAYRYRVTTECTHAHSPSRGVIKGGSEVHTEDEVDREVVTVEADTVEVDTVEVDTVEVDTAEVGIVGVRIT